MASDTQVAKKYLSLKQSATHRGLEFNLSLTSVRNIMNAKKCYYTGRCISYNVSGTKPNKLTFDRKDASLGYVKGNVVACSHEFNQKKSSLTIKDIELLARRLL
jgi:hypothetical protein